MISRDEIHKIGQSFVDQIFRTEVFGLDVLGDNPQLEFRLIVLDRVYKIIVPFKDMDEIVSTQIWQDVFAAYLADANTSIAEKTT